MDKVVLDTDILSEIIKRKDRLVIDRAAGPVGSTQTWNPRSPYRDA
jgi:hypothetical protein